MQALFEALGALNGKLVFNLIFGSTLSAGNTHNCNFIVFVRAISSTKIAKTFTADVMSSVHYKLRRIMVES